MNSPDLYAAQLLRRLRAWNLSSWRHGRRELVVREAVGSLAGVASAADGQLRPAVPDAGLHALPDQLQVLIADALRAGADPVRVDAVLAAIAADLGLRIS